MRAIEPRRLLMLAVMGVPAVAASGIAGCDDVDNHPRQADPAVLQLLGQGDQVFQGAAEAVEFGDDELVAGPVGRRQGLV